MAGPLSILCVEGDPDLAAIISISLQLDPTIRTVRAHDAFEALVLAAGSLPECIMLGSGHGAVSGWALASDLRRSGYAGTIITLTASLARDVVTLDRSDIDGAIRTPFDPLSLARNVRAICDGAQER